MKNNKIIVQGVTVNFFNDNSEDYICISDIAKYKDGKTIIKDIIRNWLRNRNTLEFLGTWEYLYNKDFKGVEFDALKKRGRSSYIYFKC